MSRRRLSNLADHVLSVTLLFGILLFVVLIAERQNTSMDFTGTGFYSLQEPTVETLNDIQDPLRVEFKFTPEAAPPVPPFVSLEQRVRTLLSMYRDEGSPHLEFDITDPLEGGETIDEETRRELTRQGVVPTTETLQQEGEDEVYRFVSSIVVSYRGTQRVINGLTNAEDLEYDLTREIQWVLDPELINVGLYVPPRYQSAGGGMMGGMRGGGQPPERVPDRESHQGLEASLQNVGLVDRIADISDWKEQLRSDPEDRVDVLFVVAARDMPEAHRFALQQFLARGGNVVLATGNVGFTYQARGQREVRGRIEKPLTDFLNANGITIGGSIIVDHTERTYPRTKYVVRDRVRVPVEEEVTVNAWLDLQPAEHPNVPSFVNRSGYVSLFGSEISVDGEGAPRFTPWLTTSPEARTISSSERGMQWLRDMLEVQFDYNMGAPVEEEEDRARRTVAGMLEGPLSLTFESDEVPDAFSDWTPVTEEENEKDGSSSGETDNQEGENGNESQADTADGSADTGELVFEPRESRVALIADAWSLQFNTMRSLWFGLGYEGEFVNEMFLTELSRYLGRESSESEDLEREEIVTPDLRSLDENEQNYYQTLMLLLSPFIVILLGIGRFLFLRSSHS